MFRRRRRSKPEPVVEFCTSEANECVVNDCIQDDCEDACVTNVCDHNKHCCEAKVVSTRTLTECSNERVPLGGKVIARIPVVLAELLVQADVESVIQLEEPALEIKRIQKNVHINQCKLLIPTNKLFISGFVRKNIEYATAGCVSSRGISGDIRHTTVNIPFECVTAVNFDRFPQFFKNKPGQDFELELLNKCLLGADESESTTFDFEGFTEKPFCELVFAFITEADIECNNLPVDCNPNESTFQTLKEKMVINLLIKVLQNQQIRIPAHSVGKCD